MMSAVARGRLTFSKWTFLCRVYNQNQKVGRHFVTCLNFLKGNLKIAIVDYYSC
jgi:hypothetical protein